MLRQSLHVAASLLAVIALAACSSHQSENSTDKTDAAVDQPATVTPRAPTVFDDQLKALDKAKAVEKTLQQEQADRDKQIDEQSGG